VEIVTDHDTLYAKAQINLINIGIGKFRLSDLIDNPPAVLGRKFRNDVVIFKKYPNVRRMGVDAQSVIYEKF